MSTSNIKAAALGGNRETSVQTGILFVLIFLFILPLVSCPLWGQEVQKQNLSPENYQKFGRLLLEKVSPDERWASFKMFYDNGPDTLFVRSTEKDKTYSFPTAKKSAFTSDGFISLINKDLHILDLKTGKTEIIHSVSKFSYLKSTDLLAAIIIDSQKNKKLAILTHKGKLTKTITDIKDFWTDPDGKNLIYTISKKEKTSVTLLNLKNASHEILLSDFAGSYSNLVWQNNGKSLAFNSRVDNQDYASLHYYILQTNKLYTIDSDRLQFPNESYISDDPNFKLRISDDGERVFFNYKIKNSSEPQPESPVEIWNGNDQFVYSDENILGGFYKSPKVASWNPFSDIVVPLTTPELPKIMLSGNQKHALLSNPKAYEPQMEMDSPKDFYIMNVETGEKKLCIKKQSAEAPTTIASPTGKYIAYFRENNWWIYNIMLQKHLCITKNINTKFSGKILLLSPENVLGAAGWSLEDKEILLYDQYDIWAVRTDGSSFTRLTHGKETKTKYRIPELLDNPLQSNDYEGLITHNFDIQKDMILRVEGNDGKTGWIKWNSLSGEKTIIYENTLTDQLYYNPKSQKMIYTEQDFNLSPRLVIKKKSGSAVPFFQSNPQLEKFHWGRSELIYYQNKEGQQLKGVLLFPAGYDAGKKYPMIVNIYELQSYKLHQFHRPYISEMTGFNNTNATLDGYFVLLPDLIAQPENIGDAVTDCVSAAVNKILEKGIVDPKKIGLIGHSFGAYETSFIITHTNLFTAAVAGCGITDLTSMYLTVSLNSGKPEMWRFEKEQWLLGKTLIEAPFLFQKNSPIYNANKVNTPLLLWAGKEDKQVDVRQSIEYYLMLRRLGKKTIMLLYPEEAHVLFKTQNQIDLTTRIQQWFNYYLKADLSAGWITKGTE